MDVSLLQLNEEPSRLLVPNTYTQKKHNKSGMTPNTNQTESKNTSSNLLPFPENPKIILGKKNGWFLVTWFSAAKRVTLRPGRTSMSSRLARYMDRAITLHHSTVAKVSASGDVGSSMFLKECIQNMCFFLTYRNICVCIYIKLHIYHVSNMYIDIYYDILNGS